MVSRMGPAVAMKSLVPGQAGEKNRWATAWFVMGFLLFVAGTGSGCFGSAKAAVQHYYELPAYKDLSLSGPKIDKVVRVEEFDTASAYDVLRLAYRVSTYEIRYYGVRQWVSKPGALVASSLRRALEASKRFRLVTEESPPVADYSVQGKVLAIEEVDHGPRKGRWYAHLGLRILVRSVSDGRVVWRGDFDRMVPVRRRRAVDVVAGLTRLMRELAKIVIARIQADAGAPRRAN